MQTIGIILLVMVVVAVVTYFILRRNGNEAVEDVEVTVRKSTEGLYKIRLKKGETKKISVFDKESGEFQKLAEIPGCHFIIENGTKELFLFQNGELLMLDSAGKKFVPFDSLSEEDDDWDEE